MQADGPGATYAKLVRELADKDPAAFICHYYNFYFAHTAGGRMIGNKVRYACAAMCMHMLRSACVAGVELHAACSMRACAPRMRACRAQGAIRPSALGGI